MAIGIYFQWTSGESERACKICIFHTITLTNTSLSKNLIVLIVCSFCGTLAPFICMLLKQAHCLLGLHPLNPGVSQASQIALALLFAVSEDRSHLPTMFPLKDHHNLPLFLWWSNLNIIQRHHSFSEYRFLAAPVTKDRSYIAVHVERKVSGCYTTRFQFYCVVVANESTVDVVSEASCFPEWLVKEMMKGCTWKIIVT